LSSENTSITAAIAHYCDTGDDGDDDDYYYDFLITCFVIVTAHRNTGR